MKNSPRNVDGGVCSRGRVPLLDCLHSADVVLQNGFPALPANSFLYLY